MPFKIHWHNNTRKFLGRLPSDITGRIIKKIKSIEENPFRFLEHLEKDNFYKLRIGDYRALIEVDFENKKLIVKVIDKRSRIYKRK